MSIHTWYYEPPDPHSCSDEDCDGVRCWERAVDAREDALLALQEEREGR